MTKEKMKIFSQGQLVEQDYSQYIKYMGSKSKVMSLVLEGINEAYDGRAVCDLFAGSCSLAGAIGHQTDFHSNDIQNYSAILAKAYLTQSKKSDIVTSQEVIESAAKFVELCSFDFNQFNYDKSMSLKQFNVLEKKQQNLINTEFEGQWHLFTKYYSGTWWTASQCVWIDAIRQVAESYKETPNYSIILASLMYAMAYTSQGTGHYAQYRDAKSASSMKDISIYRRRSVVSYFQRKMDESRNRLESNKQSHRYDITSLDYKDCLEEFSGGTVYADPPYCFVHYSRFYHALETLVLYDYPDIQVKGGEMVKGRYRDNRHQSPFSIRSQVTNAFVSMFEGVKKCDSNLVLSYSNTGMISVDALAGLLDASFKGMSINMLTMDHQHMTLGRVKDRHREVKECLFIVK